MIPPQVSSTSVSNVSGTKEEHLKKAEENLTFRKSIDLQQPTAMGWYVTVTFYTALHYIEAYFTSRGMGFNNHHSRGSAIQRDSTLSLLYDSYRSLEDLSREARYDCSGFNVGDLRRADASLEYIQKTVIALL